MKLLVVSWRMPWDGVASAGRKTHNYYLKRLGKVYHDNLFLISFCEDENLIHCDLDRYGIQKEIISIKMDFISKIIRGIRSLSSKWNLFDSYGGISPGWYLHEVYKRVKQVKKKGFVPDIIILEWTQMLFAYKKLKSIFPDAKFVASEHDVSYLSYKRKIDYANKGMSRYIAFLKYKNLRKTELDTLNHLDFVFLHNMKDMNLLIKDGLEKDKMNWIVPYFMKSSQKYKYSPQKKDIVFFGAMARPENYLSAIWFIENVLYNLENKSIKFYIIGGNPADQLKKYKSNRVILTGFVDNVHEYFQKAMCLVAPLVLGGGIKIKVLEGLAFGIPVLTNTIGIEGIPAVNGRDYLHCESKKEYIDTINKMCLGKIDIKDIPKNARNFVSNNFQIDKSFSYYNQELQNLVSNKKINI